MSILKEFMHEIEAVTAEEVQEYAPTTPVGPHEEVVGVLEDQEFRNLYVLVRQSPPAENDESGGNEVLKGFEDQSLTVDHLRSALNARSSRAYEDLLIFCCMWIFPTLATKQCVSIRQGWTVVWYLARDGVIHPVPIVGPTFEI